MTPVVPLLLAVALVLGSRAAAARARLAWLTGRPRPVRSVGRIRPAVLAVPLGAVLGWSVAGPVGAVVAGVGGGLIVQRIAGARRRTRTDPLALAGTWDLLAACLRSGLPVPSAVRAVAADLPDDARSAMGRTAELLALGADPVDAWAPALACPQTAGLARGARRTARSGAALADVAAAQAVAVRDGAGDAAEAAAQRAGVLVTGPLGLCFLPAFVCLGIVPVVAGLAAQLSP
jgi:pilus assembly protein TadC